MRARPAFLIVPSATLALLTAGALAVEVGNVHEFAAAGEHHDFSGGSFHSNPGVNGVGGPNEGYLQIENISSGNFGTRSASIPYIGDWIADGATGVAYWLRNVGDVPLEIHFSIGTSQNFWQHNIGVVPTDEWQRVIVTFDRPQDWTRIIGAGTFQQCLEFSDRIHLRHDLPPFFRDPDNTLGVLGIDRIKILGECPGDTNADYLINFTDLNAVLADFGATGPDLPGDVNGDGTVNFTDLNSTLASFGVDCAAP